MLNSFMYSLKLSFYIISGKKRELEIAWAWVVYRCLPVLGLSLWLWVGGEGDHLLRIWLGAAYLLVYFHALPVASIVKYS